MANILTSLRVVCGLLILFFPPFSMPFYLLCLAGGFTDAIDGAVARRLGQATGRGAKFDTAADFVFAFAILLRLAGSVSLPGWVLIWLAGIAALKLINVAVGAVKYRRFITVHSVINRVCGCAAFASVFFLGQDAVSQTVRTAAAVLVCLIATAAAVHEGYVIRAGHNNICKPS